MSANPNYSLMLHGGAGALDSVKDAQTAVRYLDSIRRILEYGRDMLELGASSLQTVEACASMLEDDPVFNAGCGSVLNEHGKVEMDAAIMDGRDLQAGSVAAVQNIGNPVQLARLVMSESEHVLLIAEGAMRFADHCGVARVPDSYFFTADRIRQLEQARLQHKMMLDHDDTEEDSEDQKYGTIGAIAYDLQGDLAAATSTGGIVNKRMGRVGDSPIIGAGTYADNRSCAVSATGHGEYFIRATVARDICARVQYTGAGLQQAADEVIHGELARLGGDGGIIAVDTGGNIALVFNTPGMYRARIGPDGRVHVAIYGEPSREP